jgi:anhydro-N-acetylmuramic acid kinase
MSGTSVDAIDLALVRITPDAANVEIDVIAYSEIHWTSEERDTILRVSTQSVTAQEIAIVDRMIGERFCSALKQVAKRSDVRIDAIGFHGQTVAHVPSPPSGHFASTLQLGNPYVCAQTFKCPVVFDFRRADMVSGGQGAPLVPAADSLMFHRELQSGPIAIQNIGGIGNVTYLAADRPPMGFDTGPGNMVLDQVMFMRTGSAFDDAGKMAATGTMNVKLLEALSAWHIPSPPPVSYGREHFGKHFVDRILAVSERVSTADLMATISEWTATTICQAMLLLPSKPDCVFVCGGGAHNKDLIRRFERLSGIKAMPLESIGITGDAREATAFAVLADARLRGVTFDLHNVTGSQVRQRLGAIALP